MITELTPKTPTRLYSIGTVQASLFWWDDLTINENLSSRPTVLTGNCIRLFAPVAYQRIIQIDKENQRYLLQTKCGGRHWFVWACFDQVHTSTQTHRHAPT